MRPLYSLSLSLLFLASLAFGQTSIANRPSIRASGEAVVYAKPDRAVIEFRVTAQASSAQAAAAQNAAKSKAVTDKLRATMSANSTVDSSHYALRQVSRYPDRGGLPVIEGYGAESSIELTTEDLASVPRLIDAAAALGQVEVTGVRFIAKDATQARSKALSDATRIARGYAETLAAAQGVKLGEVLSVDGVTPPDSSGPSTLNAVRMPSPGESVAVHASVVLTIAIHRPPAAER